MYNTVEIKNAIQKYKNTTCSFLDMECAFAAATGDEVLNNMSEKELLEAGSTSFQLSTDEWVNVEYRVVRLDTDNLLSSIIKITGIDII